MSKDEAREKLIEAVIGVEEDIARLYEAYANSQPKHEEFWFGLVLQEADHTNLIHELLVKMEEDEASFTPDPQHTKELDDLRAHIAEEKARSKGLSFTEALQAAIDIERSTAKQGFYSFFKNRSGAVASALYNLHQSDAKHLQYLEKTLERYSAA